MACAICKTRREKRHCPGVQGDICTVCCGAGREETIDCPLDCEYLLAARAHEKPEKDPAGVPHRDFPIPESFIKENFHILALLQRNVLQASLARNARDFDVREALEGLVRTYQTLVSGLYCESRPANPIAAAIFDAVQQQVAQLREMETQRGLHKFHDRQFLTLFVFLQQLEYVLNNQRQKGRRFISNLLASIGQFPEAARQESSSLIIS